MAIRLLKLGAFRGCLIIVDYFLFFLIFEFWLIINKLVMSSVVARNNDILKKLVLDAKREYEKVAEHPVHIFMADT
jgi:hypothetical protein